VNVVGGRNQNLLFHISACVPAPLMNRCQSAAVHGEVKNSRLGELESSCKPLSGIDGRNLIRNLITSVSWFHRPFDL
jgi:hypothetical protein